MNKISVFFSAIAFAFTFTLATLAYGEDSAVKGAARLKAKAGTTGSKMVPGQGPMEPRNAAKGYFNMMLGTVSGIDTTDPSKIKIEVRDGRDNRIHTVEVTPATSVTKATDISELKVGDTVRITTRKIADKEVAMGVMFGKLKVLPIKKLPQLKTMPAPETSKTETPKK